MSDSSALPPLPLPDEDSRPFWEGCRRGELLMQRCASCGRFRYTPRRMCPGCQSSEQPSSDWKLPATVAIVELRSSVTQWLLWS